MEIQLLLDENRMLQEKGYRRHFVDILYTIGLLQKKYNR
jgi:hypothetical protein